MKNLEFDRTRPKAQCRWS